MANGNSAASNNYWREEDIQFLTNIKPYRVLSVTLLDRDMLEPSQKGTLPLSSQLSSEATDATVLPELKSSPLISLGKIYNDNCTIILDNENLVALKSSNVQTEYDKDNVVLQGHWNKQDGLWDIPITRHFRKRKAKGKANRYARKSYRA